MRRENPALLFEMTTQSAQRGLTPPLCDPQPSTVCQAVMGRKGAGLTLIELVVGIALLIVGITALLLAMNHATLHTEYLRQFQVAFHAAQGELEELAATEFDTLRGSQFANANRILPGPTGQCVGMGEDRNCNGAPDAGEDLNGNGQLDEPLPGGRLSIRIRSIDTLNPAISNPTTPSHLDIVVTACWSHRGRVIGEDQDCDGVLDVDEVTPGKDLDGDGALDSAEDANGNGWMDAPVTVSTRVARRG